MEQQAAGSAQTFAEWIAHSDVDELVEHVCREVTEGIEGSEHRAGVVKCGTGYNAISPLEQKTMEVIVRAQQRTGAPMHSHTEMGTMGLEQAQLFKKWGLDLSRLCFAHMDRNPDPWLHRQIANTGAFLSFDGISPHKISSRAHPYPGHPGALPARLSKADLNRRRFCP